MTEVAWTTRRGVVVERCGEGEPVLLLHGIGGSAASYEALSEGLTCAGYAVHAWNAPGYGPSADPKPSDADPLLALLEVVVEIGAPVRLVGTSWGGVLALRAALAIPGLIHSLVVADSTRGSGREATAQTAMAKRVAALRREGSERFATERAPRLVSPVCDARVLEQVRRVMAQVRLTGYKAAAQMMARTDLSADLPRIRVPVLVLVGDHDRVTGLAESQALADGLPSARLRVVTDAGHAAVTERPTACAEHMLSFWKSCFPRASITESDHMSCYE